MSPVCSSSRYPPIVRAAFVTSWLTCASEDRNAPGSGGNRRSQYHSNRTGKFIVTPTSWPLRNRPHDPGSDRRRDRHRQPLPHLDCLPVLRIVRALVGQAPTLQQLVLPEERRRLCAPLAL